MAESNAPQRTPRGTFAKGTKPGPGRPAVKTSTAYRYAARRVVSDAKWKAIVDRAIDQAKSGNAEARRWLASIIVNEPVPENVDDVLAPYIAEYAKRYGSDVDAERDA